MRRILPLAFLLASIGCSPPGPRTIASTQPGASHVTADLGHVYWVTSQAGSSSLMVAHTDDDRPASRVSTLPGTVDAIAVDEGIVYLAVSGASPQSVSVIRKVSHKRSAPPKDLVQSRSRITSMAFDATHLYFTQAGPGVAGDDASSPGVLRVMRTGGTPFNVVMGQPGEPRGIALGAAHVFWVNAEPGRQSTIMSARKAGGAPVPLATVPEADTGTVPGLAADDAGIYYKTRTAVLRIPADGGKAVQVATVPESDCRRLLMDARALYFLSPRGPMRLPLDASAPNLIANGPATDLAIADQHVYWVWNGSVMQGPKLP